MKTSSLVCKGKGYLTWAGKKLEKREKERKKKHWKGSNWFWHQEVHLIKLLKQCNRVVQTPCSIQLINIVPKLYPFITSAVGVRSSVTKGSLLSVWAEPVTVWHLPSLERASLYFISTTTLPSSGRTEIYISPAVAVCLWFPLWANSGGRRVLGRSFISQFLCKCHRCWLAERLHQQWGSVKTNWMKKYIWLSALNTKRKHFCWCLWVRERERVCTFTAHSWIKICLECSSCCSHALLSDWFVASLSL